MPEGSAIMIYSLRIALNASQSRVNRKIEFYAEEKPKIFPVVKPSLGYCASSLFPVFSYFNGNRKVVNYIWRRASGLNGKQKKSPNTTPMKKGMIKVSVLYPNGVDKKFDIDYYCNKHVPMVLTLLSPKVKSGAVEEGLAGDAPATYLAMGHLYFDSVEDFQSSFAPNAEQIMGDIQNFTNTEPVIQISEVKI